MSASARARMASNGLERWLISRTDMPTPGSAIRSRCISSSTGSGSTAGPAAKLWTRWTTVIELLQMQPTDLLRAFVSSWPTLDRHEVKIEDVEVAILNRFQQRVRRRGV